MGTLTDTPHAPGTRISVANCRCPDCTIARTLSDHATNAWLNKLGGRLPPPSLSNRRLDPALDRWEHRTNPGAHARRGIPTGRPWTGGVGNPMKFAART